MIYAAVCDFKLKHLSRRDVERLPETNDDSAALKMYMLAELSRNENNRPEHDALIAQMVQRFPTSRWLEEALYSGGNMYLLKHDSTQAIYHYALLVENVSEQHLCAVGALARGVDELSAAELLRGGAADG